MPSESAIVVDASADLPRSERRSEAIHILPERWHVHGRTIADDGEPSSDLVEMLLDSRPAHVDPPDVHQFEAIYDSLRECERVLSLHSAQAISPAVDAARTAAARFPNVTVLESTITGVAVGLVAVQTAALLTAGAPPPALEQYARHHLAHTRFVIVPDTLNLHGPQKRSALRLLAGHSMMSAEDGGLSQQRRVRSRRATLSAVTRYFTTRAPLDRPIRLALAHADAAGSVDPLFDIVERLRPNASVELVGRIGPRILRQLGHRCVGMAWIVEDGPGAVT